MKTTETLTQNASNKMRSEVRFVRRKRYADDHKHSIVTHPKFCVTTIS